MMAQMRERKIAAGIALGLALMGSPAQAAEDGGMIYLSGGGNLLNPAPLNTLIQPGGYKALDSWTWGQGLGMYAVFRRILIGVEYQALWGQLSRSNQESLKLEGNYSLLQAGYLLVSTPTFQAYPYVGFGRGTINLYASQPLNGLLSVSQGSNQNLSSLSGGSWLVDLGLGANVILPMSPQSSDARGPSASLRAGWLLPVGNTEWSSNQLPVSGGPALNPGGLYLRLMIGFGGVQ